MGSEVVGCCTETLSYNSDDDSDGFNDPLTKFAKQIYENEDIKDKNNNNYLNVPKQDCYLRERSDSLTLLNDKKNPRRKTKKKRKSKHNKKQKRSRSFSSEYDDISRNKKNKNGKNETLEIEYEILRKQNEEFINKHYSYFMDTYNSISPLSINSMSPLSVLSDKETNIILSYSDSSFPFPISNKSRERSYSLPISTNNNNNNNKNEIYNQCQCVTNCLYIKRIIDILQIYSIINNNNNDDDNNNNNHDLLKNIDCNELLTDYQHLLNHHLIQKLQINMAMDYVLIKNEINKQIKSCDIKTCNGYKRYMMTVYVNKYDGKQNSFLFDLLDLIHCFLMHLEYLQKPSTKTPTTYTHHTNNNISK